MHTPLHRLLAATMLSAAALAHADTYTTVSLPTLNADLRTSTGGDVLAPLFPGLHTWVGVPFQLDVSAQGNTSFFIGVLDIPVGVYGVTSAYTLINSGFGAFGSNNGSIEFFGTSSTYKVDLVQGVNIRDYYDNIFNNVIDGVNAVVAYVDGRSRLDAQIINLPQAFASETLVSMRFTSLDQGQAGQPFISAATVAVAAPVPEPGGVLMLLSGGVLLLVRRRWAAAA